MSIETISLDFSKVFRDPNQVMNELTNAMQEAALIKDLKVFAEVIRKSFAPKKESIHG